MAVAEWSTDLFSINDVRLPENKEPRCEWLHVKSFYFGNLVSKTLKLSEIQTPQDKSPLFFFPFLILLVHKKFKNILKTMIYFKDRETSVVVFRGNSTDIHTFYD